jgi:serine protease Do
VRIAKKISPRLVLSVTAAMASALGSNAMGQMRLQIAPPSSQDSQPTSAFRQTSSREEQFAQLSEELGALERQVGLLRRVVKLVSPTVVHIEALKENSTPSNLAASKSESPRRVEEAGAGVIVELKNQLYVVTNRHVVHPASPSGIKIRLNDQTIVHPTQIWSDPATDIALLAIDSPNAVPAKIGDSSSTEIGDFVLAVGSPFGLAHSVSYGIISAKGRRNLELGVRSIEIQDFFQTDAAINPGNSGGPLMNLRGEVIGINTAIASNSGGNEGIGFSIPMNLVVTVANQLLENGELSRAYLGVQMENNFDIDKANRLGLDSPRGVLVKAVKPNSPAAAAGIIVGDVILRFDGIPIEGDGHLVQTVGLTPIGKTVDAVIIRNRQQFTVKITLSALPSPF